MEAVEAGLVPGTGRHLLWDQAVPAPSNHSSVSGGILQAAVLVRSDLCFAAFIDESLNLSLSPPPLNSFVTFQDAPS